MGYTHHCRVKCLKLLMASCVHPPPASQQPKKRMSFLKRDHFHEQLLHLIINDNQDISSCRRPARSAGLNNALYSRRHPRPFHWPCVWSSFSSLVHIWKITTTIFFCISSIVILLLLLKLQNGPSHPHQSHQSHPFAAACFVTSVEGR